jgi:ribose-phosphate pyrophosphokinase
MSEMLVFALSQTAAFGEAVAKALGTPLAEHEERDFKDGEHKTRPLQSVRGHDVYVIQSLYGGPDESVNDKLCRLLFFIGALRDNGAARVTAVTPYLAYGRKDRRTKPRDPLTTRYIATLFEAVGTDRVIALDVHNLAAFQNAWRCEAVHLDTRRLFAERVAVLVGDAPVVVASPDPGGVKRAQLFRETLEGVLKRPVDGAFVEKRRSAGVVSGGQLSGDVAGAIVLIVDDLISTGGTMERAASVCREQGAAEVYAFAAHGLFTGAADSVIAKGNLAKVFVTDTVPPFRLDPGIVSKHVEVLSAAPLFAEAIWRCHEGGSITRLLEG